MPLPFISHKGLTLAVTAVIALCTTSVAQVAPPNITVQPITTTSVCQGATISHTFTATGSSLQYRWWTQPELACEFCSTQLFNNSIYSGTTTNTLTINTSSLAVGTYYYTGEVYNPGGPRFTNIIRMDVLPSPTNTPATTSAARCEPGSLTLSASGALILQSYRWFTASTGPSIPGQTTNSYTTPALSTTTTYYVAFASNLNNCVGPRTAVTATIYNLAAPTTFDGSSCGSGAVSLFATGGTTGQYRWYTDAVGGTPISGQTNSFYTTPELTNTTTYYVSINNGPCESERAPVTATIDVEPDAPSVTGAIRCTNGELTLTASGGTDGQYRWFTGPTEDAPIDGETSSTYTTPFLTSTTNYYVSIYNGACEGERAEVTATIASVPGSPSFTSASRCGEGSVTLTAGGAIDGQYRWYLSSSGGTPIVGQTGASYTTPVLTSTTPFYVAINNGACEGARATVMATINPTPDAPTVNGASRCGNGTLTLVASGGQPGQYRWYTEASGGTQIIGQTEGTYITPSLSTTTTYYVSTFNATCESERVAATATVTQIPAAPTTTGASGCGAELTLTAAGGTAGNYRWYSVPTGGTPIAGATGSSYLPPIEETTTFYVSVVNGSCEGPRTPVTATVTGDCNEPPVIDTVEETTTVGSSVQIDLVTLVSDPNNNLNLSTLTIVTQPKSGATASIDEDGTLIVNYSGVNFSGVDELTISVCDLANACTEQVLSIIVGGKVNVYNAVSPNGDGKNDKLIFEYIEVFPTTRDNDVTIYNRWGDVVASFKDYDNNKRVFTGLSADGKDLPSGTYYYKIYYRVTKETVHGYFELRR